MNFVVCPKGFRMEQSIIIHNFLDVNTRIFNTPISKKFHLCPCTSGYALIKLILVFSYSFFPIFSLSWWHVFPFLCALCSMTTQKKYFFEKSFSFYLCIWNYYKDCVSYLIINMKPSILTNRWWLETLAMTDSLKKYLLTFVFLLK